MTPLLSPPGAPAPGSGKGCLGPPSPHYPPRAQPPRAASCWVLGAARTQVLSLVQNKTQRVPQRAPESPVVVRPGCQGSVRARPSCSFGCLCLPVVPLVKHTMERSLGFGGCRGKKKCMLKRVGVLSQDPRF